MKGKCLSYGTDMGGSDGAIRTHEIMESESIALPLGYTAIFLLR